MRCWEEATCTRRRCPKRTSFEKGSGPLGELASRCRYPKPIFPGLSCARISLSKRKKTRCACDALEKTTSSEPTISSGAWRIMRSFFLFRSTPICSETSNDAAAVFSSLVRGFLAEAACAAASADPFQRTNHVQRH